MTNLSASAPEPLSAFRSFLSIFLAFLVLLTGIAAAHFYTQYQADRVAREAEERVSVALARRAVLGDIDAVVTDLMVLARNLELELDSRSGDDYLRIARVFGIFAAQKRLYDQIRYIDETGWESVRVNFRNRQPVAVAEPGLQDKSGRYYFRETIGLNQGQLYISPLDLNMEQGRIEQPFKPMLRFATPVFDVVGQRRGILVLNYLGQRLLNNFREAAGLAAEHIHLTENRGYWLSSPVADDAWGFMLAHGRTFGQRFPLAWQHLRERGEGQFVSAHGLFTFTTVLPLSVAAQPSPAHPSRSYAWKIIAHLPPGALSGTPARFLAQHSGLYVSLLALLALGSWLLARSRVYHHLAQAQSDYERRFRHTLENIELAAVSVDRQGRVVFCNPYFLSLTDWRSEQIVGRRWLEIFVPEEDRRRIQSVLAGLSNPEAFPKRYEAAVLTRHGGRRLIAWHNSLSLNPLGEAQRVTAIGEDITEKRRVEQEWIKLHRAVEQSPSMVLITDQQGRIEYVNPKFTEVTGYQPEEVEGRNPRFLQSGETGQAEYAQLWQTLTSGSVWHGEFHNRRKNGDLYWESAAISAVRDAAGTISHFLAVKEDISERKRLEAEVNARSQELARAQSLAQMGRMASMIAHDLRNPLSSIKMTLQVIGRQSADNPAADELTGISLQQVAYMEAILNDMLTYTRPQELRLEWIDAGKLMDTAIGLVRRKIEQQGVRVVTNYQKGLPTFPGDPNQLRQVFSNLIVNGIQAMEQVAPAAPILNIVIDLDLSPAGTAIRFDIIDAGIGLEAESVERLFEPFFTTRAKGTGLGLAIVKQILQHHRGEIYLLPVSAGGTCARVLLPTVPPTQKNGTAFANEPEHEQDSYH
jgi:PAS domain S-box-containing protein